MRSLCESRGIRLQATDYQPVDQIGRRVVVVGGQFRPAQQQRELGLLVGIGLGHGPEDRKSTRLNSSHLVISYAVFCLKKKTKTNAEDSSIAARTDNRPLVAPSTVGQTAFS